MLRRNLIFTMFGALFSNTLYIAFVIWPGIIYAITAISVLVLPIVIFPIVTRTKYRKLLYDTENKIFIYIEVWAPTLLNFIVIYILGLYLPKNYSFYIILLINYAVSLFVGIIIESIIEFIGLRFGILKKADCQDN